MGSEVSIVAIGSIVEVAVVEVLVVGGGHHGGLVHLPVVGDVLDWI